MGLEALKATLDKATASDLLEVEAHVSCLTQMKAVDVALERRSNETKACIKCGVVGDLAKWGRSRAGTQRFRCRACKATFGATNQTPFYRLRKRQHWAKCLGLMGQHVPLWRLQRDHKIPVSIPTLHRWRHRFLSALVENPIQPLAGMVEADEKFFRTSFKGSRGWKKREFPQMRRARRRGGAGVRGLGEQQVPTLTAVDRSGAIYQSRVTDLKHATIVKAMTPWVESDSVICSDGNDAYAKVAKATGCEHIRAKVKNRNTAYGNASGLSIGRIDAYHRDVENLINRRCMGVSTRYLMNYFGWARRITQHKPFGPELMGELLSNNIA